MLTVRKARVEEAQAIIDLHCDTMRRINVRDYTPAQIETWLGARRIEITEASIRRDELWVCVDEGGTVWGEGLSSGNEVFGLYVSADRQGQGIGGRLLAAMEREIAATDAAEIVLTSTLTAVPFYHGKGYQEVERVTVGRAKLAAVRMRKPLDPAERKNPLS